MQKNQPKTEFEEACNALSHLIACALFVFLAFNSPENTSMTYAIIFSIMFFSSFLYHAKTGWKNFFRNLDMFFIYVVIGASGLLVPRTLDPHHAILIVSVLSLSGIHHAIRGILDIPEGYAVPALYLANGLIASYVILSAMPYSTHSLFISLAIYLAGFVFYINDHIKYFHAGWHIACCAGAYFMHCHLVNNLL